MSANVQKVAFVCLPDDQLEVFSSLALTAGYEPEIVINFSTDSYAYSLAEILEIPTSTEIAALRRHSCDLIVVPDGRRDLEIEVAEVVDGEPVAIRTVSEVATMLGVSPAPCGAQPKGRRDWIVPFGLAPAAGTAGRGPDPVGGEALTIETFEGVSTGSVAAPEDVPPQGLIGGLDSVVESLKLASDKELLLQHILRIAISSVGGDSGSIMLIDESGGFLRIAAAEGLSEQVVRNTRQRIGDGVAGNVLLEGRSRILTRTLDDPRYRSGRERSALQAAVCVPVMVGARAVGVVNVNSDARADAFDEHTIKLLERFCVEMAGVILKALTLSPSGGASVQATLGNQIDGLMALDGSLRRRLEAVAEAFAGFMEAEACRIYLLDCTRRRLDLAGERITGSSLAGPRSILASTGIIGWVMRRGKPESFEPSFAQGEKRAMFYFPLIGDQGPLGVIEAESVSVTATGFGDVFGVMEKASARLSALLEQERSRMLQSRRSEQVLRLSELAVELVQSRNSEEIREIAARSSAEIFGADVAVVRSTAGGWARLAAPGAEACGDGFESEVFQFEEWLSAHVLQADEVVTPETLPDELCERLAGMDRFSWVAAIPLRGSSGEAAGVISLYGARAGALAPREDERALMERLGRCLGRALGDGPAGGILDPTGGFVHWSAFLGRVGDEAKRAKRFGRSFAVTSIELDGLGEQVATNGPEWADRARSALARFVRSHVREVDLTAWADLERIVILRPEASSDPSSLVNRLRAYWERIAPSVAVEGITELPLRMDDVYFGPGDVDWRRCIAEVEERFGRVPEVLRKAA